MDFADNYSPVVNAVTFRVVVARMLIENLKGKVVDIDNAFGMENWNMKII